MHEGALKSVTPHADVLLTGGPLMSRHPYAIRTDADRRHAFGACLLLALSLTACSGGSDEGPEAAVRERALAFGDVIVGLADLTENEARDEVRAFIEPGAERSEQVASYVAESRAGSGKFRAVASSVESVELSPDGDEARVVYSMVARGPDGREIAGRQLTEWRLVDGAWYRTLSDARKSVIATR